MTIDTNQEVWDVIKDGDRVGYLHAISERDAYEKSSMYGGHKFVVQKQAATKELGATGDKSL